MIHHIKGTVTAIENGIITIDVAGVGFGITVTRPELYSLSQSAQTLTYMHWNQETGPQLFGFATEVERQTFILIIGCSGIGPKIALSLLNQLPPREFLAAISLADTQKLSTLKGIGLKKAESMILQLQDKVKKLADSSPEIQEDNSTLLHIKNLTEVLNSLHYSRQEIAHTIEHLKKNNHLEKSSFDDLIRKSLSFLAKTKNS